MFDMFLETVHAAPPNPRSLNTPYTAPAAREPACYLLHIVACAPDAAEAPMWNNSPLLDAVSLGTIPAELNKVG